MRSASPGFSTAGVMVSGIDLSSAGYDAARQKTFQHELLDRVRALGGVRSAAYARVAPFSYRPNSLSPIVIEGYATTGTTVERFREARIRAGIVRDPGARSCPAATSRTDDITAQPVAIVNEAMAAEMHWPAGIRSAGFST